MQDTCYVRSVQSAPLTHSSYYNIYTIIITINENVTIANDTPIRIKNNVMWMNSVTRSVVHTAYIR